MEKNLNHQKWELRDPMEDCKFSDVILDNSISSEKINVYFKNIKNKLIENIRKHDIVVGCVAWLTDFDVLDALSLKDCQIIVQKEDFLRPDEYNKNKLKEKYEKISLQENIYRYEIHPGVSVCCCPSMSKIRCVGNYNREKNPAFPRMHNKFLVFGNKISEKVGEKYEFTKVWTGSYNFTKNAGLSLENAVLIKDDNIANAYFTEYQQIFLLSESLDWEYDWVSPEYRIGT